jgi:hypothetical protein
MKKAEFINLIREEIQNVLEEITSKIFKLRITNKNGTSTIVSVSADPNTTELFTIVSMIKASPKVKDVEILEN